MELIKTICPACGSQQADQLFNRIDCCTKGCRNYSETLASLLPKFKVGDKVRFIKYPSVDTAQMHGGDTSLIADWSGEPRDISFDGKRVGRLEFYPGYEEDLRSTISRIHENFAFLESYPSLYVPFNAIALMEEN